MTHSQIINTFMNIRPKVHVDLCYQQTPNLYALYRNKLSDILCAGKLHIKDMGCAGHRLWRYI